MTTDRPARTWPLLLLALPAFVAIWSGWVGIGERTGFGVVQPFPGIPWLDEVTLNTAITLPIGMEAYAAYALRVWLAGTANDRARTFARWSAIGALTLGSAGQAAYHLMVAEGIKQAPWQITTLVSCLPVAVLGMGVALAHLQSAEETPQTSAPTVEQPAVGAESPTLALVEETVATVTALAARRTTPAAERPAVVSAPVPEAIEAAPSDRPKSNRERAREMYAAGTKQADIARTLGVRPQTVSGYLKSPDPS